MCVCVCVCVCVYVRECECECEIFWLNLLILNVKLLNMTKKGCSNKIQNFEFPVRQLKVPMITKSGLQLLRISMVIVINMKYMIYFLDQAMLYELF